MHKSIAEFVKDHGDFLVIGVFEEVGLEDADGNMVYVPAKVDTGALRTSIDLSLAKRLGIYVSENIVGTKEVKSALGLQVREVISITLELGGKIIHTNASVSDRTQLKYDMIVGRRDLEGFVVTV